MLRTFLISMILSLSFMAQADVNLEQTENNRGCIYTSDELERPIFTSSKKELKLITKLRTLFNELLVKPYYKKGQEAEKEGLEVVTQAFMALGIEYEGQSLKVALERFDSLISDSTEAVMCIKSTRIKHMRTLIKALKSVR